MDLKRVRRWDWLAAVAGVVLFIDLFVPWYGTAGQTANAWLAFTYVDLILALGALLGIALPIVVANQRAEAGARLMAACVFWVALVGAILAVIRIINVPGVDTLLAGGGADITRQ